MKVFKYILIVIGVLVLTVYVMFFIVRTDTKGNEYTLFNSYAVSNNENQNLQGNLKLTLSNSLNVPGVDGVSSGEALACPYGDLIVKWADTYNLDSLLVASIVAQESNFGEDAGMSGGGALGIIQIKINDGPIQQLKQVGLWEETMSEDMTDPDANLHVACCYLKYGYDTFVVPAGYKDDVGALAAGYNGWWPSTLKYNPPCYPQNKSKENWNYYHQVKQRYNDYVSGAKKVGEK